MSLKYLFSAFTLNLEFGTWNFFPERFQFFKQGSWCPQQVSLHSLQGRNKVSVVISLLLNTVIPALSRTFSEFSFLIIFSLLLSPISL